MCLFSHKSQTELLLWDFHQLSNLPSSTMCPHLSDERSVLLANLTEEILSPVVGVTHKHLSVQHGGVAELGTMTTAQQAPGQLTLVHHGCHHKACFFQGLSPELKALEFGHHTWLHYTREHKTSSKNMHSMWFPSWQHNKLWTEKVLHVWKIHMLLKHQFQQAKLKTFKGL